MTSESYVWVWLPGHEAPVPAGIAVQRGPVVQFAYGERYRQDRGAISLFDQELPLERSGFIEPLVGLDVAGCLNDAGPDSWGQRVILNRLAGAGDDFDVLNRLTYLAEAGSDRIGALDFQPSPRDYEPRGSEATLADLLELTSRVEAGEPIPTSLEQAVRAGSSVGGARPKALLTHEDAHLIAKFSSATDTWPIVRAEFLAMTMAAACGLDVARVRLEQADGRDVLLVDRFDREPGTRRRRAILSALTLLELPETSPQYAAYGDLAELVTRRFTQPRATLRKLFARIAFNILCGNTDDHARNHAAFWDGASLTLTPAYDICPYPRVGGEATQAMRLGTSEDPYRFSNLAGLVERASIYGLTRSEALTIVHGQLDVVRTSFDDLCERARLSAAQRKPIRRVFPHGFALQNLAG